MAPHDAFGRPLDEPDPTERLRSDEARAASVTAKHAEAPPGDRGPGRPAVHRAARLLGTLAVLAVGAAAIAVTMSRAVDRSHDDQRVAEHALADDPLGPRSLLRTVPLRRAMERLRDEADPDERIANLSASPERLLVTLIDDQDQQRWLSIGATGGVQSTDLNSTAGGNAGAPLSALSTIDPAPATRFLARKYAALQPHAREPTLVLVVTSISSSSTTVSSTGARAGIPQTTTGKVRYRFRWSVGFRGVRQADANWTLNRNGKLER